MTMGFCKLTSVLLCACMLQTSSAFLAQIFGPNGIMGMMGGGGGGGGMFGRGMMGGALGGAATGGGKTEICRTVTCLEYTVIRKGTNYELRRYPRLKVATTQSRSQWMPSMTTFSRLRGYMRGKNSEAVNMTTIFPVIKPQTAVGPQKMMMVIPFTHFSSPPEPLSPKVVLEELPAMDVYARPFQSSIFGSDANQAAEQFKTDLGPSESVVPNQVYVADYNAAFSFFGRFSEIWLVAAPSQPAIVNSLPVFPFGRQGGLGLAQPAQQPPF